jgi:hypothetical protein
MKTYDAKSTALYALGVAIQHEDDEKVKRDMEELEEALCHCDAEVVI